MRSLEMGTARSGGGARDMRLGGLCLFIGFFYIQLKYLFDILFYWMHRHINKFKKKKKKQCYHTTYK